jgi:hypothetical protein
MKRLILLSILVALGGCVFAQATEGRANLEKLCGCFSVNFRYAETFSPDDSYEFHDREDMNAVELVLPLEKTDTKIVMQHLLIVSDSMIVKHWREEWVYEAPVLLTFEGDRKWSKKMLDKSQVKGKWTQTVWEVSDEPRYQGMSGWIQNDGASYWESTADAPLPRREYTIRNDYNVMKRRNRITVTADGYIHEQDNDKILRKDNNDKLIAQEKGYNSYFRIEESECKVAKNWWDKNGEFWNVVRRQWQSKVAGNSEIVLKSKVDDKMLHEHFAELWKDWKSNKVKTAELAAKVRDLIAKFDS